MTSQRAFSGRMAGRLSAFTLIELLVVIAIISILLGIAVPAVKSMTKGNAQKQAVNLITAMISNAHATALQTHTPCGLVIYEDPSNKNQSAVQLIQASAVNTPGSPVLFFIRVPRSTPQFIPASVKIATIDSSGNLRNETSAAASKCRCIMFDENGQMMLRNGLGVSSTAANGSDPNAINLGSDAAAAAWNLSATNSGNLAQGVSTPGLIFYDNNEFVAANIAGNVAAMNTWLQQHADIIIVNAYTGNVIRDK